MPVSEEAVADVYNQARPQAVLGIGNVPVAEVDLYDPEDHYQGLIKVRLNGPAPYRTDEFNCDRGSPVYYPYYSGHGRGHHIIGAQPVCILLDYVQEHENTGDRCEVKNYMYCISVHRIIHNSELNRQDLQLHGENFA
ncbi:4988_t:CDS:2 [Paraglomus brasilianum]|uniref:4988_t:CDS:1 n=1 Tax=Paraglomus brasilianum TaxID=144538 RepID=A0A9N9HG19_9GLOM|nr:4988_t:CDS:2 [Paraglomus brasilianum]